MKTPIQRLALLSVIAAVASLAHSTDASTRRSTNKTHQAERQRQETASQNCLGRSGREFTAKSPASTRQLVAKYVGAGGADGTPAARGRGTVAR